MEPNVFKITNLKRCNTFIQITKLIFYNVVCCLAWFLFRGLGCGVPLGFRLGPLGVVLGVRGLDFLGRYPVGPGGVLGGHRISDFGGGVAWDSRLNVKGILRWGSPK